MLFQITHTHTHETCPAVFPERLRTLGDWFEAVQGDPDVKLVSAYAAPMDHVLHVTLEADEFGAVVRAMGPLNALGTAVTAPVLPVDELLTIARSRAASSG